MFDCVRTWVDGMRIGCTALGRRLKRQLGFNKAPTGCLKRLSKSRPNVLWVCWNTWQPWIFNEILYSSQQKIFVKKWLSLFKGAFMCDKRRRPPYSKARRGSFMPSLSPTHIQRSPQKCHVSYIEWTSRFYRRLRRSICANSAFSFLFFFFFQKILPSSARSEPIGLKFWFWVPYHKWTWLSFMSRMTHDSLSESNQSKWLFCS